MTPGHLSDHYDPRQKVLRLSHEVYQSRRSPPSELPPTRRGTRSRTPGYAACRPQPGRQAAGFGSNIGLLLAFLGVVFSLQPLLLAGIILFSFVVFPGVNLPVEFNASSRAKEQLATLGIVIAGDMTYVRKVLNAAAATYVAATLQAILTLLIST